MSTGCCEESHDGWDGTHVDVRLDGHATFKEMGRVVDGGPHCCESDERIMEVERDRKLRPRPGCHPAFSCDHDGDYTPSQIDGPGVPDDGDRVSLCVDPRCEVNRKFRHVEDIDGRTWGGLCDRMVGGRLYRSSSCERTCHGCGSTRSTRTDMFMCSGCYALVPYVRGRSSMNRAVLATDAATSPVYCGLACQSEHWWSDVDPHSQFCPRYDQAIHSLIEDLYPDIHEHDARVPFGAIQSDGTSIPWLVRSSLALQGLHGGMGYS